MNRVMQVPGRTIRLLLATRSVGPRRNIQQDRSLELKLREEGLILSQGVGRHSPDVLLLDATLPKESCRSLLDLADAPAIILGTAHLDEYVIPCLIAGARGYLSDHDLPCHLREAAETVLRGDIYAGPALVSRLFSHLAAISERFPTQTPIECPPADLTGAETRVLRLVADGLSNQSIADSLGVSRHTVANHVHGLLRKLNAKNRAEAVIRAGR
jgi:DNA-binding NarL/FixJ family response regulator